MVQSELGLNGFCGRGPDEGLGVPVGGGNVAGNRGFEVVDRAQDAPFEALPSELGEEAFHGIEPGAGGRCEVERPSRMLGEPGQHLRMFTPSSTIMPPTRMNRSIAACRSSPDSARPTPPADRTSQVKIASAAPQRRG